MRLVRLELENFCQHRRVAADFHPGLNAIIGPNGSGKSNLVTAAYYALTGDLSRNVGVTTSNICDFAPPGEPSTVKLGFVHDATTAEIFRDLRRPASRRLDIGAPPARFRSEKDIQETLTRSLGVDTEMLANYVFVAQWDMFSVLSLSPTKRASAFQRLFGLDLAEVLYETVGEESNRVLVPAALPVGPAEERVRATHARVEEVERSLEGLRPIEELLQLRYATEDRLRAVADLRLVEEEMAKASAEIDGAYATLVGTSEREARAEEAVTRTREEADAARRRAAGAASVAAAWSTYDSAVHVRASREAVKEQASQELLRLPPIPPPPVGFIDDVERRKDQANTANSLDGMIHHAESLLSAINPETGCSTCPTCGTSAAVLAPKLEEARQIVAAGRPLVAEIRAALQVSFDYDRELAAARWRQKTVEETLTTATENLDAFVVPLPPSEPRAVPDGPAVSLSVLSSRADFAARAAVDELVEAKKALARATTQSGAVSARVEGLAERIPVLVAAGGRDDWEELDKRMAELSDETTARIRAEQDLATARADAAAADTALVLAVQTGRDATTASGWKRRLDDLRSVFHPSALPRARASRHLAALTESVNDYLTEFGSPFHVTANDDLSFTATFPTGSRPAGRLSGGQKVVLALAFRLSVNTAFAGSLGLLCLDEPTVGLDRHNMDCLARAIERLGRMSRATGLQVVMVTHERSLTGLFDNTVSFYS